ncbi:MAG: 3-sulfinopropanoyl-CoA desulfinase [Pseudomonadota bacterium]
MIGPTDGLADETRDLQAAAAALAAAELAPRAAEVDRSESYPFENVRLLKGAGFLGMTIPKGLGGPGRSLLDAAVVIEEIAQACAVSARIVVETNMGALLAILRYGSPAQAAAAAAEVLAGDKPAICITEPGAGSAATEMTTTAERRGDRWVLNGKKHWITGGGVSNLHLIFARVIEEGRDHGIGAFIAYRDRDQGLVIGAREPTMGLRGIPETEVIFDELSLPLDRALAFEGGPARGFGRLMNAYNSQRVGAASVALGLGKGAYREALSYVQEREQFGRPIAEFQGLQWMLADMAIQLSAAEGMVRRAAIGAERLGFPDPAEAAAAKVFASETAVKVTNDALQLHGAAGYSRARPVERMVRDARMFTIGGGTAQVLRTQVASRILGRKLPQTRDGYAADIGTAAASAAPGFRPRIVGGGAG